MPQLQFVKKTNIKINQSKTGNVDMTKGMQQYLEPDKYDVKSWQKILNGFSQYGNIQIRNGINSLAKIDANGASDAVTDWLGLDILQSGENIKLITALKQGANTTIASIDQTSGAVTDFYTNTGVVGEVDFAGLRGYLYQVDGSAAIKVWDDPNSTQLSNITVVGTTGFVFVTSDEKRIWAVDRGSFGDVVYFSESESGAVTSFSSAGDTLGRGGIANTDIIRVKAIDSIKSTVIICGENSIELHEVPSFAKYSITTFPADMGTILASFANFGVHNNKSITKVGSVFYVMCTDGVLRSITTTGSIKNISNVKRLFEQYDLTNCALGYDAVNNNILISVSEIGDNDTMIAYNLIDESFSQFDNCFADAIVNTSNKVFMIDNQRNVYDAMGSNDHTDDLQDITMTARSQMLYLAGRQNKAELTHYGVQARYKGAPTLTTNIYADKTEYSINADFSETQVLADTVSAFGSSSQPIGMGIFGGTGYSYGSNKLSNEVTQDLRDVHVYGVRHEIEFSVTADSFFALKAYNLHSIPTNQNIYTTNYTN